MHSLVQQRNFECFKCPAPVPTKCKPCRLFAKQHGLHNKAKTCANAIQCGLHNTAKICANAIQHGLHNKAKACANAIQRGLHNKAKACANAIQCAAPSRILSLKRQRGTFLFIVICAPQCARGTLFCASLSVLQSVRVARSCASSSVPHSVPAPHSVPTVCPQCAHSVPVPHSVPTVCPQCACACVCTSTNLAPGTAGRPLAWPLVLHGLVLCVGQLFWLPCLALPPQHSASTTFGSGRAPDARAACT